MLKVVFLIPRTSKTIFIMGRAMQKVNDLYDSYYELYSMFEDDFEQPIAVNCVVVPPTPKPDTNLVTDNS